MAISRNSSTAEDKAFNHVCEEFQNAITIATHLEHVGVILGTLLQAGICHSNLTANSILMVNGKPTIAGLSSAKHIIGQTCSLGKTRRDLVHSAPETLIQWDKGASNTGNVASNAFSFAVMAVLALKGCEKVVAAFCPGLASRLARLLSPSPKVREVAELATELTGLFSGLLAARGNTGIAACALLARLADPNDSVHAEMKLWDALTRYIQVRADVAATIGDPDFVDSFQAVPAQRAFLDLRQGSWLSVFVYAAAAAHFGKRSAYEDMSGLGAKVDAAVATVAFERWEVSANRNIRGILLTTGCMTEEEVQGFFMAGTSCMDIDYSSLLGQGGYGCVYKGTCSNPPQPVGPCAIKVVEVGDVNSCAALAKEFSVLVWMEAVFPGGGPTACGLACGRGQALNTLYGCIAMELGSSDLQHRLEDLGTQVRAVEWGPRQGFRLATHSGFLWLYSKFLGGPIWGFGVRSSKDKSVLLCCKESKVGGQV